MIAYPWIVARVEGKDVTTGPITTQEGDFCLSCGTNTRPDGSCECDGWEADE
jgi:hypothetical protein